MIRLIWRIGSDIFSSVVLEVLDQAWDGPVDQVAAVCQVGEVHPLDPMHPSRWASA